VIWNKDGLYTPADVTPYIHSTVFHVSEMISLHGSLIFYSTQALEKQNHLDQTAEARATSHGGSRKKKSIFISTSFTTRITAYYKLSKTLQLLLFVWERLPKRRFFKESSNYM